MTVALIIIGTLLLVGAVLYVHERFIAKPAPPPPEPTAEEPQCCGMHITCEKDSLLPSVSDEIEYYDDEELDRYKGRAPDQYTDQEIEAFRDILLTLLPQDIAGWARSLQLRQINLPTDVRDELLLIVSEARANARKS